MTLRTSWEPPPVIMSTTSCDRSSRGAISHRPVDGMAWQSRVAVVFGIDNARFQNPPSRTRVRAWRNHRNGPAALMD